MYLLEFFLFNLPELLVLSVLLSWQRCCSTGREKEKRHTLAFPLVSAETPGQMSHHPLIDLIDAYYYWVFSKHPEAFRSSPYSTTTDTTMATATTVLGQTLKRHIDTEMGAIAVI